MTACLCCAVDLPDSAAPALCAPCSCRPVLDAVRDALLLRDRQLAALAQTAAGRRQLRRARLRALIDRDGKRCTSCHGALPAAAFAVCDKRGDGLQSECKGCGKVRVSLLATPGAGREAWYTVRDALRAQNAAPKNNL